MRNMLGEIEVDNVRYFEELNFQSSQLIDDIAEWLTDPAGLPLVLQGDPGSGREYCLKAACYNARNVCGLPWKVISIDWTRKASRDPQKIVERLREERPDLNKEHIDWLMRFAETFNLPKGPVVCFDVVSSLILNIPNIVNFIKTIYNEHDNPKYVVPGTDSSQRLISFLKTVSKQYNLVLHILHADLSDLATLFDFRDNICKPHDDVAKATQQQGRLLFACSCSSITRTTDLVSSNHDRILSVFVESSISEQTLRSCMDRNFSPNRFSDELIAYLHEHGRAKEGDRFSFSIRIASVVAELLEEKILVQQGGCWILNPKTTEEEISKVIGAPLQSLCTDRLNAIEQDLRPTAKRFMELAALCRQWIPVQLLTQYMELDEEREEQLFDCLDDIFVDNEPALLIDEQYGYPGFADFCFEQEIAIYRFVSPLLAVARRPGDYQQEAEKLLAFFDEKLPKNDRAAAALCWQVAEQAGSEVRERWRERLAWYFEPEMAERFSDTLLARMEAGLVSPGSLLKRAGEEKDRQSVYFLQAIICACDRWYEGQGGVPSNQTGGLFLSLFGVLLDDLGQYQDALQKHEEALKLKLQVYPKDHPNIATSLSNIGITLGELGRHEEALIKLEAALEMRQKVLPQDHPNIAASLNNIGASLGDLGRHEEALIKHKAALEIRQKVLPKDHPDIANSLAWIGSIQGYLGRHQEALEKYQVALDMQQRLLPQDHPHIANSLSNLGKTLGNLDRHEEALVKQKDALAVQERVLSDHPRTARTLRRMGNTLSGLERYHEALEKYQAALDMQERLLPAEHPETAKTRKSLKQCQEKIRESQ
ncbi:MAG: tetratricopeptide repeat protein [Candidatus Electrothrix sp. AU1_5]|nr:tetratricopeptide repeat protein [Candidatus Electrothrix gigas]